MQAQWNIWLNRVIMLKLTLELSMDKAATSVSQSGFLEAQDCHSLMKTPIPGLHCCSVWSNKTLIILWGKLVLQLYRIEKDEKTLFQYNTDKCVSFIRVEAISVNVLCIRSHCLTHCIYCTAAICLQRLNFDLGILFIVKLFQSHIRTLCLNQWWFLNSFTVFAYIFISSWKKNKNMRCIWSHLAFHPEYL